MSEPVLVHEHYRGGGPAADPGGPPPGNGAAPAPGPGGGGGFMSARWGPLPVWGWAALAGVLAVGAFFWIRRGQAGAAQAAAQNQAASTAGTPTDTGCYDQSGNSVPCAQADYAGQIAALQAEIDNMQGSGSTPISVPGAGSTTQVTVPDVVGDGVIQARATCQAAGLRAIVQGANSRGRGTVTAQSPSAGTTATLGDTVTLTVTSTPATTTTPAGTPTGTTNPNAAQVNANVLGPRQQNLTGG